MSELMSCPFGCGFGTVAKDDTLALHVEQFHSDGPSPFVVNGDVNGLQAPDAAARSSEEFQYVECPIDACGEIVTMAELNDHVELHAFEEAGGANTDAGAAAAPVALDRAQNNHGNNGYVSPYSNNRNQENIPPENNRPREEPSPSRGEKLKETIQQWKNILKMPSPRKRDRSADSADKRRRLGKAELGKYAHEDKMPGWLVSLLQKEGQVIGEGVIPVLAQLLRQTHTTAYAYLCHPSVWHVSKLRWEGGFCGYRNIQMMCSYIISTGSDEVNMQGSLPSIFAIQDYIENAWDLGINARGRIETGGIRGTRKYIGTPEAQAMFTSLEIPCDVQGFKNTRPGVAEGQLLEYVESYFLSGDFDPEDRIRCTKLPPIYFQHRGHSLTIVGLERRMDGSVDLLIFDPVFRDSPSITKYIGRSSFRHPSPDNALNLYRRGNRYLRKYHEFEVLRLSDRPTERPIEQTTEQHPKSSMA